MQPEISRRCVSCGTSVRSEAMFCPECGESLLPRPGVSSSPKAIEEAPLPPDSSIEAETEEPGTASVPIEGESFAAVRDQKAQPKSVKVAATTTTPSGGQTESATPIAKASVASAGPERAGAKARERLHRASTAARGAIEENVKRVERIRQVSSVMLEEAHYDASLRFVLVAIVLFVIVVVLLVLSKVMG